MNVAQVKEENILQKKRKRSGGSYISTFRPPKVDVTAKCPNCETLHVVRLVGRYNFMPRIYCPHCAHLRNKSE